MQANQDPTGKKLNRQKVKNFISINKKQTKKSKYEDRKFLFDIVANKKNGVDVDKFDYIERDAYNLGLRISYDPKRLSGYSRVINNEICYHQKEVYNVYEMFHTRYTLFRQIYNHRVGKALELMIVDAFMAASKF